MIKNQIIQAANTLFAKNGINAVSVEQIASAAGVTAETVNAEFNDKSELLEECLKQEIEKIETAISTAHSISQSVLENLVLVMYVVFKEKADFSHAFFRDLNKYPITQKHLAIFTMKAQDCCVGYFKECMEEGYFIANENQERIAMIYIEQICNLVSKRQYAMIQTLLKGICTQDGLNELMRIETIIEIRINKIINQ